MTGTDGAVRWQHAIEAMADSLRRELAHEGIKVTLIEPGSYATSIVSDVPDIIKHLEDETSTHGACRLSCLPNAG